MTYHVRRDNSKASEQMYGELMAAIIDCRALGSDCKSIRACFGEACQQLSLDQIAFPAQIAEADAFSGQSIPFGLQS